MGTNVNLNKIVSTLDHSVNVLFKNSAKPARPGSPLRTLFFFSVCSKIICFFFVFFLSAQPKGEHLLLQFATRTSESEKQFIFYNPLRDIFALNTGKYRLGCIFFCIHRCPDTMDNE